MDDDGGHSSRTFSTRNETGCMLKTFGLRRARKSVFRSFVGRLRRRRISTSVSSSAYYFTHSRLFFFSTQHLMAFSSIQQCAPPWMQKPVCHVAGWLPESWLLVEFSTNFAVS